MLEAYGELGEILTCHEYFCTPVAERLALPHKDKDEQTSQFFLGAGSTYQGAQGHFAQTVQPREYFGEYPRPTTLVGSRSPGCSLTGYRAALWCYESQYCRPRDFAAVLLFRWVTEVQRP